MTKQNLVNYIAEETGMTKADATRALDAARQGRNPRTGEAVTIPARTAVSIKAGAKLKDALN